MKSPIKVLIVDDEVRSRSILHTMLSRHFGRDGHIEEADHIDEALRLIGSFKPDIVLLDVELGLGTGFDLLGQLSEVSFQTIFVTAYDSFAIKAIKWSATDYLLKPIDPVELIAAVNKATAALEQKSVHSKHIIADYGVVGSKLGLPCLEGLKFVNVNDIVRCEARGNYTEFHFIGSRKLLISKPLQSYEEILAPHGFFRIHHSHLINLDHIKEYIKGRGGTVVMQDGQVITVAARKRDEFLNHILH